MALFIIGFLLFFIVPCVFVYALIRPKKFNIRTKKNAAGRWTLPQAFAAFALLFLVATILMVQGALSNEDGKTNDKEAVVEKEVAVSKEAIKPTPTAPVVEPKPTVEKTEIKEPIKKQNKTFGITVAEYEKRLLALAKEVGLGDFKGKPIEIEKGDVNDTFSVQYDDSFGLVGTVDKNGELNGLLSILGKTTPGSNQSTSFLLFTGLNIRALTPDIPKEQVGEAFLEVINKSVEGAKKTGSSKNSKVIGDVNITVSISELTGILVNLTPAE